MADEVLGEEVGDGAGDDGADVGQAGEDGFGCAADVFQRAECLCQRFGGAFADVTDAEREQEAGEFGRFAGFYACEDVFRPLGRLFLPFGVLGSDRSPETVSASPFSFSDDPLSAVSFIFCKVGMSRR